VGFLKRKITVLKKLIIFYFLKIQETEKKLCRNEKKLDTIVFILFYVMLIPHDRLS
jgi:hypothetical protein